MMTCHELALRIEHLQPQAAPRDVARLCLLLANAVDDLEVLREDESLCDAWTSAGLRLQALSDQHAAMTEDLEALARENPPQFSEDDLWKLFRAIKVQSRVLDLYVGQTAPA